MALLRPAPGRIRLLFAAPPARSGQSIFCKAPRRRDGLEEVRKRAAPVSKIVIANSAADADDAGATSTSPFEETAELRLEALGLSHASARRLVRRAAALRKRFRASGGSGNGSIGGSGSGSGSSSGNDSDGGGGGEGAAANSSNTAASRGSSRRARSTTIPTAADVDAAARALLAVGFRIGEVAAAMERAPGLLNVSPGAIERRAASFLRAFSSPPEEASEKAAAAAAAAAAATTTKSPPPSPPAVFRSTLVRILRHRPAALCARSAEKGLRASLAALRSLGATPRSLSRLAREDPSAFWRRPADFLAAAEALSQGIAGCPAKVVPRLLCEHPRALLGPAAPSSSPSSSSSSGSSSSASNSAAAAAAVARALDWLRSPPLSLPPERAAAVLRAEPALVARERHELDAVAAALASAGLGGGNDSSEDLRALVEAWPRVLTKKAADVGVKARLATEVLGAPPRALARSPRLLFDRSVSGSIGPRFAFYRARRGAGAGGGGRSDDEEEQEEEVGSEGGQDGKSPSPSSSSSSSFLSSSSLSPSTLLRGGDTDFCLAVGGYHSLPATEEEFSIFRRRWEAEAERGLVAEGLAEERKRLSRREQRQRRRQRRQRRSEEAEAEEAEGEREEAASTAAAEVAAAAAVAAALAARNLQQKQQQRKQQGQRKEQQHQKPEAAGAALEAIATLRTKKKEGGGGGQK